MNSKLKKVLCLCFSCFVNVLVYESGRKSQIQRNRVIMLVIFVHLFISGEDIRK